MVHVQDQFIEIALFDQFGRCAKVNNLVIIQCHGAVK